MRWVDAWNDLYDVFGGVGAGDCVLPDGRTVGFDEAQGFLQRCAYSGGLPGASAALVRGRRVAVLTCTPDG